MGWGDVRKNISNVKRFSCGVSDRTNREFLMNLFFRFIIIILLFLNFSCNPSIRIKRIDVKKAKSDNCEIYISDTKNSNYFYKKIAEITVGDTGFTTDCGENKIFELIKINACKLGGDAFLIKKYKVPDFSSTCYRVKGYVYQRNTNTLDFNIILGQVGIEIFGLFDGLGYGQDYLEGYKLGLEKYGKLDLISWKKRTSYLKGFMASKKNQPLAYAKLAGEWVSLFEAKECNNNKSVSEECVQYKEISPKLFM